MRKVIMLLLILTSVIPAVAQDKTVPQLIKELEGHPQEDAQRVDKLNDLSISAFFPFDERKKLSEEAVSIAQKINYTSGEAYALANAGFYKVAVGKVKEGDSLKHIFTIKNVGDSPLFIYKAAVTCDCVATSFSTEPVAAGKEAEVAVFFKTKGRKGPQTRTVSLQTNTDPAELTLIITADVQ